MRISKITWKTFKENPSDAEIASHKLLIRAGLAHKLGVGLYAYLPFGLKVIQKIERVVRKHLDFIDCQEMRPPFVTPGSLWKESGRWSKMGKEMLTFEDRSKRPHVLSPTNEEAFCDVFKSLVKSYKELPVNLYQINTKFRDEIRPRFGLMRAREFIMKDAYSFHTSPDCMEETYQKYYKAYEAIFNELGLEFSVAKADAGAMADSKSKTHEFHIIANAGEDAIIFCPKCNYCANQELATQAVKKTESKNKSLSVMEKVATPECKTIEEVCRFLKVEKSASLKSLVFTYHDREMNDYKHVLCLLRGSDEINESKLKNLLQTNEIFRTGLEDLEKLNLVVGSIGPVGVNSVVKVLFDKNIVVDALYTVGANEKDFHYINFLPNRDYKNLEAVDLKNVIEGDQCPECSSSLLEKRGVEIGHIFQLGDYYTKSMNVTVLDKDGKKIHPLMGCYGIGISRLFQASIEQNHDENGIYWPKNLAPFQVYLIYIGKSHELKETTEKIYHEISKKFEVLYDDRDCGPGQKFKDADLLGLPIQLVIGEKEFSKSKKLEIKLRRSSKKELVSPENLENKLLELWKTL